MLEEFHTWKKHFEDILEDETKLWESSAVIDLDEGNPILALYTSFTLKAVRVIKGCPSDRDPYGMWVKYTSADDLPDDSISEYVFKYREVDSKTLEAFKIFLTVWINKDTDYDYMKFLIEKFQKSASY